MPPPRRRPAVKPSAGPVTGSLPPPGSLPGTVIRAYGKFFETAIDGGPSLLSTVRGSVRRERLRTDLVAVGDRVWVTDVGEGEGQIELVEPRRSTLGRLARHTSDVEQVILANPDQALFLFSVRDPEPHPRMLDRFLVLAESRNLPAAIGVNKMDLDEPAGSGSPSLARSIFGVYETSYPVFYLCARTGLGFDALRGYLRGRITAVTGPSGVGKSSLLNSLDPEGLRDVGVISDATGKGRHTTTATILRRIPGDDATWVADTPGIRALSLLGISPDSLDALFPELRPFLGACFYADCTHLHEPGCPVREALEAGSIPSDRFESYAALRRGESLD